jgi:hypothetical protein
MDMMIWEMLHPNMTPEHLGLLPGMLDLDDPRPAKEQFDQNYAHGGGWDPFNGFELSVRNWLSYPGDPPLQPLAQLQFRDELIVFYIHSWVAIIQPDRSFEVCRMD